MTMTHLHIDPPSAPRSPLARFCEGGLVGLWGRLRHREPDSYARWLRDQDMTAITAALMRLSERQLSRIGMTRQTLALDIEDLAARSERERAITRDVIEIVATPVAQQRLGAD